MTSRHFAALEFRCRCGRPECDAPTEPVDTLMEKLDLLRDRYGQPIVITSGLRCPVWNAREQGEPDSGHLDGTEVDIACPDSLARYRLLGAVFADGLFHRIGVGAQFLHLGVSTRLPSPRVWTYYTGTKRSNSP